VLLQEYALALRARNRDAEAERLLRRALSIQQSSPKADPRVTIGVLNTLGNLLEGRRQFEDAEKLERAALALSEKKLRPESIQLAMTAPTSRTFSGTRGICPPPACSGTKPASPPPASRCCGKPSRFTKTAGRKQRPGPIRKRSSNPIWPLM
jgi:hypothetical protein